MSDLIDRQKAIRNICNEDCHQPTPCKWKCIAIEELEALPSVQPRKGKISYTKFCEELWGQSSICGLCGCSWQIAEDGDDNFCPNCGADMREGDSDD